MTDRFHLSYPDSDRGVEASLITTWDKAPATTDAPTFTNMAAALFSLHGVQRVALFRAGGLLLFLVRGPHEWVDVTAKPVNVRKVQA